MPELPDITVYIEALDRHLSGRKIKRIQITNPFLIRTYDPAISELEGQTVQGFRRLGKRIVWQFSRELYLVMHLMIAGRLLWKSTQAKSPGKICLARFDFDHGSLLFTEAGSKRRASIHVVRGDLALNTHQPGGLEVLEATCSEFCQQLRSKNHTLKRALTAPHLFSGIGNSFSDEILHRARLSPITWTQRLSDDEVTRLYQAARDVLQEWIERLRTSVGTGFPDKVTAFRPEMAVHGRFGHPCPICQTSIQRIVYAENETNYCPRCQTEGKLLADRGLSRLLKSDWPGTIDEWEDQRKT